MDDTEDESRYTSNSYGAIHQQDHGSSNFQKLPARINPYLRTSNNKDMDDEQLEEEEEGDDEDNGVQRINTNNVNSDEDEDDQMPNVFNRRVEVVDFERHPKNKKLKHFISNYKFAPRVAAPSTSASSAPRYSLVGHNPLTSFTEHETSVLLDAWGERFVKNRRKSLRSEEWQEVADIVSQVSIIKRTDTQCRNRLDTLKKKYKKEKTKIAETSGATSEWVFFKKMDLLMANSIRESGLTRGLDSGEYVFTKPEIYLNHQNGLDEMRDSLGNSESDSDELPPKKRKFRGNNNNEGVYFKLIADSINTFTEIFKKVENSKRQQMVELEKMRMDFRRDLEMQERQILEKGGIEIAKIYQGDYEENDVSTENPSG